MIRDIKINDIDIINMLGTKYDNKFTKHFDLLNYINNNIYILKCYEEDNIIKGFIIATKLFENIEILLIYVDDNYKRLGIGTKLLQEVEKYDGIENILLEVSKENIPAFELYNKMGYTIISTREKYYNGIDAIIMKKVLK